MNLERLFSSRRVVADDIETKKERIQKMNIIHCENCRFWQDGYCTLRKKETCDGATCDKAEEY